MLAKLLPSAVARSGTETNEEPANTAKVLTNRDVRGCTGIIGDGSERIRKAKLFSLKATSVGCPQVQLIPPICADPSGMTLLGAATSSQGDPGDLIALPALRRAAAAFQRQSNFISVGESVAMAQSK